MIFLREKLRQPHRDSPHLKLQRIQQSSLISFNYLHFFDYFCRLDFAACHRIGSVWLCVAHLRENVCDRGRDTGRTRRGLLLCLSHMGSTREAAARQARREKRERECVYLLCCERSWTGEKRWTTSELQIRGLLLRSQLYYNFDFVQWFPRAQRSMSNIKPAPFW